MASIIVRARKQKCVYWQQIEGGRNDMGIRTYAAPVEIKCRWSNRRQTLQKSHEETVASRAKVMVDRAMKEGDYLMEGALDSSVPNDPTDTNINAYPIVWFKEVPD